MDGKMSSEPRKVVGQTASAGFQIGVRRTLPISKEQAWELLISPEGIELWIGEVTSINLSVGETFQSKEGITGELRVVKPFQQLRMRWTAANWERPSTLQIRLLSDKQYQTTISFHQEKLDGPDTREQMKLHWESVLATIMEWANLNSRLTLNG